MSSNQLNSKNNGPVLLLKTIIRHWNCLISSVATDGKNGQRLKLENVRLRDRKVTRNLEVRPLARTGKRRIQKWRIICNCPSGSFSFAPRADNLHPRVYSSRAKWPLAPNFSSCAKRKSYFFHTNHIYSFRALDSLQFSLEHSLACITSDVISSNGLGQLWHQLVQERRDLIFFQPYPKRAWFSQNGQRKTL